jgi:hypothetical protein
VSEQLPADARVLADIERRLRTLETAPRVGLHRLRYAYATAAVDPTVYGAWESGAAGSTWRDDRGVDGTGYAQVTVETNTKALVFFGCRVIELGANAGVTWKTSVAVVGVNQDGVVPSSTAAPTLQRVAFNPLAGAPFQNISYTAIRTGLTPGQHVFTAQAFWQLDFAGAPTAPRMTDTFLGVLPIN